MKKLLYILVCISLISCKENEPPTVTITAPGENTLVIIGEPVIISASANDPDGVVDEVRIAIDNIALAELSSSPFTYTLNTEQFESGNHVISAVVFDDQGAVGNDEVNIHIALLPTVNTMVADSITYNSARIKGSFSFTGFEPISQVGFYWGGNQNPIDNGTKTVVERDESNFSLNLSDLDEATNYYYAGFTSTILGESIGEIEVFSTPFQRVSSLTDIDDNTYKTVRIGNQWWMAENLRTTKFNDGTDILEEQNPVSWEGLSTPAYSWYENEPSTYSHTYGALYNYYTLGSGNLCPEGWHVSTDDDWKILEDYLGMAESEVVMEFWRGTSQGAKLTADSLLWVSGELIRDSTYAQTTFAARPGGVRTSDGIFQEIGEAAHWWTSNSISASTARDRIIHYQETGVYRGSTDKRAGLSVRCVQDE